MTQDAAAAIEGRIDPERPIQTHLARALLPLVRGRRTGALQLIVTEPRTVRTQIVVVDGQIAFAESEVDASRLLERLVDLGALGTPQAIRIEARLIEERGWSGIVKASELAVSEAEVRPDLALTAISEVVAARVAWCLRQTAGTWVYRDDPRAAAVPRYPVPFEKTVLEALAHPECAPLFEAALERYARHYPRLEGQSNENTTLFGMTPSRFRTLRLLDGAHALTEILATSPMGKTEAASLIAGLTMFERIWWNATPAPRAPTGTVPAQAPAAPPRPLTMERAPSAIQELRALEQAPQPVAVPGARPLTMVRGPTPAPPASSPKIAPTPAVISELLRRGGRPATQPDSAPQAAPSSQLDTLSAFGHFDRGKTHLAAGRLAPAGLDFGRALELEPGNQEYLLRARFVSYLQTSAGPGRRMIEKETHDLALARIKEKPDDSFPYHVIGRLAFDQGQDERARKAFRMAERNDPKDVETLRYLRLLSSRAKK